MVWFIGFLGFGFGFALGQMILMQLLKDKSNEELKHNKDLQRKYGLLNWAVAITGCWASVYVYNHWEELGLDKVMNTVFPS